MGENARSRLKRALANATSYAQWRQLAEEYDRLTLRDRWRRRDHSSQYDHVAVRDRLDRLRSLMARHDVRGLLYTLNEGVHGNTGGMGRGGLYSYALSGTKRLIEEYIEETVNALELLAEDDSGEISHEEKVDFFRRASHCFGHTALMLSGSGFLLFFHLGVVRALAEQKLLPSVLSGSSGGAVIGAVVCAHSDEELGRVLQPDYFQEAVPRDAPSRGVIDVASMEQAIARLIPDLTFLQSLEKSGRAINISIAPAETHQTSRLLNATTAPHVLLRSAVMASAAVPGIYPAVTLEALDSNGLRKSYLPSQRWVDGSVSDDLPAKRLARLYGVNHYIVSQTNPHVLPFVRDTLRKQTTRGLLTRAAQQSLREWFNAITQVVDRADRRNGAITRTTSLMRSVINQDYVGDINILPDFRLTNPLKVLSLPSEERVRELIETGERCTWPKIEMIRQQTRISRTLRGIMRRYDDRLFV